MSPRDVLDLDAPLRSVADERADQLAEVADRQRRFGEACIGQLAQHDLEDRVVTDRNQRLGDQRRVRTEADPLPPARITASRASRRRPGCISKRDGSCLSEVGLGQVSVSVVGCSVGWVVGVRTLYWSTL